MNPVQDLMTAVPLGILNPVLAAIILVLIIRIVARVRAKHRANHRVNARDWRNAVYNPKQYRSRRQTRD